MTVDLSLARDLAHALDPRVPTDRAGTGSPAALARIASRGHWMPAPHLELINSKLVDVAAGRVPRLIVLAPPRHGKSELISRFFPAWFLGRYPSRRVILCSYEAEFAASWGRKVRDTLAEYGPEVFGVQVREDAAAASRFDLARHRGGMVTSGVGGPITGRGADLLVIDDPVKNAEEAYSDVHRDKQWDWWRAVARTRLEPGAGVVLVMTRWHEDDLAGRMLEAMSLSGEHWEVLRLPALAEEDADDPIGRAAGEALWPQRYPVAWLNETKDTQGSVLFAAQYQGLPAPAAGAMFHREWFKEFRMLSDGAYDLGARVVRASDCLRFQTVDLAVSVKASADYTVVATFALAPNSELLVLDIVRMRLEGSDIVGLLRREYQRWRPGFIGIEKAGYQLMIIQDASRAGLPIRELRPDIDKVARAYPAAARMEGSHVYFLQGAPWRESFERELLSFPAGAHDDMVDCLAYAVTQTVKGEGQMWIEYWTNLLKERSDRAALHPESWSTESPPSRPEVATEREERGSYPGCQGARVIG